MTTTVNSGGQSGLTQPNSVTVVQEAKPATSPRAVPADPSGAAAVKITATRVAEVVGRLTAAQKFVGLAVDSLHEMLQGRPAEQFGIIASLQDAHYFLAGSDSFANAVESTSEALEELRKL